MRVVIDTNVFVSSFFGGNSRRVIDYWFSGALTLCVSKSILREYFDVLGRFEFDDHALLMRLMSSIEKNADVLFVEDPKEEQWVKDDQKDNKFIACAMALKAVYIISGDSHLTSKKRIGNVQILSPAEILQLLSTKA